MAISAPRDRCADISATLNSGGVVRNTIALSCLKSFPYNATRAKRITDSLLKLYDLHVYKDIAKGSPTRQYPVKVDVLAGLRKIGATRYRNDYSFNQAIFRLINALYDGHSYYYPNCYYGPQLIMLTAFPMVNVRVGWRQIIKISPRASTFSNVVLRATEQAMGYKVVDYEGAEVVKIQGIHAMTYAYRYAKLNQISSGYKDFSTRLNQMFSRYSNIYNLNYGYLAASSMLEVQSLDYIVLTVRRVKSRVLEQLRVPLFVLNNQYQAAPFYNAADYYAKFCNQDLPSVRSSRLPSGSAPRQLELEGTGGFRELVLSEPVVTPKEPSTTQGFSSMRTAAASGTPTLLVDQSSKAFLLPDGITGVMVVRGFFGPTQDGVRNATRWQLDIYTCVSTLKAAGATRLIIDLQGNAGGYVTMYPALLLYLFPALSNTAYPWQFPATPFTERMVKATLANLGNSGELLMNGATIYSWLGNTYLDGEEFRSAEGFFYPLQNQTFGGVTAPYSSRFSFLDRNSSPFGLAPPNLLLKPVGVTEPEFAPENILLLSGGDCFSTCSSFAYAMQEYANVRTVAVGGRPDAPMSFSEGNTGFSYTLRSYLTFEVPFAGLRSDPDAPQPLPIQAAVGYVPVQSYCLASPSIPADYVFKAATFHLPFTDDTVTDIFALWSKVATLF